MRTFSLLPALLFLGLIAVTLAADPPKPDAGKDAHKDAGKDDHHGKDEHADEHHDEHPEDDHHTRPGDPDMSSIKDGELDHDAVTGSQKEAAAFKELSPEESKKRLAVIVKKMDMNKDGSIDAKELRTWIVNSFKNLDREDAKQKMEDHDENNDKRVGWWEYVEKSYGYKQKEVEGFKKEKSKDMGHFLEMLEEDEKKFKLADRNGDGFLDENEYVGFAHPVNSPHMAAFEIEKTLKDYDKNKDKSISKEEFIGTGTPNYKMDEKTKAAEDEHFKEYDKDGNGKLEGDEIKAWVMPGFEASASKEAQHLIKETDENKDGKLSTDEILKKNDLWVGSQATDYGKHLEDLKKDEL